ncbi:hypothetical protein P171DRAFT_59920 [Karstenula rhodostoma CBS 690.94]|uniref:Ankyrin n=1 Tax=Karstenula rhodostoma CBS 690.94 TaxID=1392251 RepID=A0A9P4PDN4_9PLEO|nr:hypothetical protein P171DRAFT_59920 [Karstenula rhodostoma CBS 690.94]
MSKIEEAAIVQNENHNQTSTVLDGIITQLSAVHDLQGENLKGSQHTQSEIRSVLEQTTYDGGDSTSTQLRITTSMPLKACDWTCNCQCHVRNRSQTPQWLSAVVGTLFYCSTNTPSLDFLPCNTTACFRSQSTSSYRFTYYFPSWIMRAALVYTTWNNVQGENSSWSVKMPKEIPLYSPCWHYIQGGFVEKIRELLQLRQMSPYDIGPDGVSVLHWAESFWQLDICSLLMATGADWHFKDRAGR